MNSRGEMKAKIDEMLQGRVLARVLADEAKVVNGGVCYKTTQKATVMDGTGNSDTSHDMIFEVSQ